MASRKILNCRYPRTDAGIRLICFPWAGGGSMFYANQWGKLLHNVEVYGVCLAGREMRFKDPLYKSLDTLLDDVTSAIHNQLSDKPFAIWGHSMGGLLAYEAACVLQTKYKMAPVHMFVSGVSAPHSARRKEGTEDVRSYTDQQFIEMLKRFGGTPADILENEDVMKLFIPPMRADYELLPQISDVPPCDRCILRCPVDVFDGTEDRKHDLEAWRDISTGVFSVTMLKGGHFYLKDDINTTKICQYISESLI